MVGALLHHDFSDLAVRFSWFFCVFNKRLLGIQSHYQSMAVSVDRARKILGRISERYTDEELSRLLRKIELLARGCLAKVDASKSLNTGQLAITGAECGGNNG